VQASIGFAIPITEMFKGRIVWRGMVYALLMIFGKMITGVWLVRFSLSPLSNLVLGLKKVFSPVHIFFKLPKDRKQQGRKQEGSKRGPRSSKKSTGAADNDASANKRDQDTETSPDRNPGIPLEPQEEVQTTNRRTTVTAPSKPKSLYPSSILGLAMVARGEVGYLIASLAQSQGMFSSGSNEISEIYLVIVWAISICTLVGPICVGTLVKRVKKLQLARTNDGPDPLGVWGI
jgi:hypothetical protein